MAAGLEVARSRPPAICRPIPSPCSVLAQENPPPQLGSGISAKTRSNRKALGYIQIQLVSVLIRTNIKISSITFGELFKEDDSWMRIKILLPPLLAAQRLRKYYQKTSNFMYLFIYSHSYPIWVFDLYNCHFWHN